jgi:AcrR family transcriptional regulator
MPKQVDRAQRRREVAGAVLRLVARRGISGVTLNDVAIESSWSRGVLTHFFGNKDALLEAALRQGMWEASEALRFAAEASRSRDAIRLLLEEALPIDARRTAFLRVYVAYLAEAVHSERLREYFAYNHQFWRQQVRTTIERGQQAGEIPGHLDAQAAADALTAMAEGLSMRALVEPTLTTADQLAVLNDWIASVITPRFPTALEHIKIRRSTSGTVT